MTTTIANEEVIMSSTLARWWSGKESLFPWLPKPVKLLILLVFVLNAKSWPFVWHVKVWYPAIMAHYRARRLGLKQYYRQLQIGPPPSTSGLNNSNEELPAKVKKAIELGRSHKFEHPLGVKSVKRYTASFDDCDYNYHLSNSSYAKNLDSARMAACIELFSPLFAPGGWMALGAAHYHYIREIPMFAEYEIQLSIGGFEDKWIYLVGEYVTYPSKKSNRGGSKGGKTRPSPETPAPASSALSSTTPHDPSNGVGSTESTGTGNDTATTTSTTHGDHKQDPPTTSPMEKEIVRRTTTRPREDGGVLNCFSVSVYCFKLGRLTVPPRVALSFCGYGQPSNWARAESLILNTPDRGRKWLQSGWKDEPVPVGSEWDPRGDDDVDNEVYRRGREEGERLKAGLDGMREVVASVSKV